MNDHAIRQLAAAVMLRAVKDYFGRKSTPEKRTEILKDLRSGWMRDFTNGTAANVAEQLEKYPEEIRTRMKKENRNEE
jgi:hypothetical protein